VKSSPQLPAPLFSIAIARDFQYIIGKEIKMPIKTPVKKTVKAVKKPVKKASHRTTWDDVRKAQEETWKAIRDGQKETNELREFIKEIGLRMDKSKEALDKSMGELSNKLGSIVEKIMIPDLPKKFKALGYTFDRIATFLIAEGVYAQFDGLLENGALAIAVEVKTTLRQHYIDDHLLRMEKLRQHANEKGDTRQFMGAMAAIIVEKSIKTYALKQGLFVIEPSGNEVIITKPFKKPRVW
jgi:hypothetical protein